MFPGLKKKLTQSTDQFMSVSERKARRSELDDMMESRVEKLISSHRVFRAEKDSFKALGMEAEAGKVGLAPFFEAITFSSYSLSPRDAWAFMVERPYEVVVLPGYSKPEDLDTSSCDAIWLSGVVEQEFVIWDGFSKVALFELIYECMNPSRNSPFIKVRDCRTGNFVTDPRNEAYLARRPKSVISRKGRVDAWCLESVASGADPETASLYADVVDRQTSGRVEDWRMRNRLMAEFQPTAAFMDDGLGSDEQRKERLKQYPFDVNVEGLPRKHAFAEDSLVKRNRRPFFGLL